MFDPKDNPPLDNFIPSHPITYGDVMLVEEYLECVDCGGFIDYDGFGHPSNGTHEDMRHTIIPSDRERTIPGQSSHIVWYNR